MPEKRNRYKELVKMKNSMKSILFASFLILFDFTTEPSEMFEWTGFRGSGGMGIDTKMSAPTSWDKSDYQWEIDLEGTGNASPVVWGDKIFVTGSNDENNTGYLFAVSSGSGKILWQNQFEVTDLAMHPDNNLATATPAVDETQVYIIWYTKEKTTLIALKHDGSIQWETDFDGIESRHGGGSSLLLSENNVIFTREQEEGSSVKSSWVAVDKITGETAWELERESCASNSFSTPILIRNDGKQAQLIFSSKAHGFTCVDPASGQILWERPDIFAHRVIGSPVYSQGLLIGCYKGGGVVLEVDLNTNKIGDSALYSLPRSVSPYVPTPIVVGDLLFLFMDSGTVTCMKFSTGEVLWKERPAGAIYGSPICVGGNLYCITKAGKVIVIPADPSYKLTGINELGDGSFSTPVMCNNGMVFRTFTKLMLLENSNK